MAIFNMVGGGSGGGVIVPIDAVTDLDCVEALGQATLTRTDPNDPVYNGITLVSWTKSILVRKQGSVPTSSSDGTVVLTSTTRNQYQTNGYVDTGLSQQTFYYYAVFTVGDNGIETISNIYCYYYTTVDYLCFKANTENSYIFLQKIGSPSDVYLETSLDGINWTDYTVPSSIRLRYKGSKVFWRNKNTNNVFSSSAANYYCFRKQSGGDVSLYGKVSYLANKNGTNTVPDYCFVNLFNGDYNTLTSVDIELPSGTIGNRAFYHFLYFQQSLKSAKIKCNAMTIGTSCYEGLLQNCKELEEIDIKLPATTIAYGCYQYMFKGCVKLKTLVKLPATALAMVCYQQMYNGCSLIKLSSTKTGAYQTAYRIPTTGTGSTSTNSLNDMFTSTGGTFTGTPSINTTYYTSNEVIG